MLSHIILILYMVNNLGFDVSEASLDNICRQVEHGKLYCNYIPRFIPVGIFKVYLTGVPNKYHDLKNTTFVNRSWNNITLLELIFNGTDQVILRENCFYGLKHLQVLKINTRLAMSMNSKSFDKMDTVETLDLSGCSRLNAGEFVQAVNGSDKLPLLRNLNLSNCSLFQTGQISNMDALIEALESKRISFLDLSGLQISFLNLTLGIKRLHYLEKLNMTYVTIGDMYNRGLEQNDVKRVENIDMSYITLPKKAFPLFPGRLIISGVTISLSKLENYNDFKLILSPRTINVTGIVRQLSSYWFKNISVNIDIDPAILTKSLILRRNNVRRLDVRLLCHKYKVLSLEHVDISENGMDFIHPSFSSCFPNIQYIDLSKNALSIMAKENGSMFEVLFSNGQFLEHINLSDNRLETIPMKMFRSNRNVKTIDLSYNRLEQVHFDLKGLNNLVVLNLQGNSIHIFDGISIANLKSISHRNRTKVLRAIVLLKSNSLSCAKCETKSFISWLISTNMVNLTSQKLKCSNEHRMLEFVTKHTVDKVEMICQRKIIIKVTSILAAVIALAIIAGSVVFYTKIKHKRKIQTRENVLELLHKGEGRYKFVVFLAFSNDDEDFVNRYILHQLNENLQLMTGLDRELVCTGDRHFRPGFYVHNEGFRALDTASVVVIVASNNFCNSSYCRSELDQAYVKKKPIVLMLIEDVDQDAMIPTMRDLFQRNVRILWTLCDGEYKMKTTWENVCMSLLDLIEI